MNIDVLVGQGLMRLPSTSSEVRGNCMTKADLDKETQDTFRVTVTAEDSLNVSSAISVTIRVTNIDEMPDLEGDAPEEYAENGTRAVATFTAKDPEGESIVWSSGR